MNNSRIQINYAQSGCHQIKFHCINYNAPEKSRATVIVQPFARGTASWPQAYSPEGDRLSQRLFFFKSVFTSTKKQALGCLAFLKKCCTVTIRCQQGKDLRNYFWLNHFLFALWLGNQAGISGQPRWVYYRFVNDTDSGLL